MKKTLAVLAVLLLFSQTLLCAKDYSKKDIENYLEEYEELVEDAEKYVEKDDYDGFLKLLEKAEVLDNEKYYGIEDSENWEMSHAFELLELATTILEYHTSFSEYQEMLEALNEYSEYVDEEYDYYEDDEVSDEEMESALNFLFGL